MAINHIESQLEHAMKQAHEELNSSNCSYEKMAENIFRIAALLHRNGARHDKTYTVNKEIEIKAQFKELKGTFNSKKVVLITVISGGITVFGGFTGASAFLAGTSTGANLAAASPRLFHVLGDAANSKSLEALGQNIGMIGQGTGTFGKIFSDKDEYRKTKKNHNVNEAKGKQSDRQDSHRQSRDLAHSVLNTQRAAVEAVHRAAEAMLRG